MPKSKPEGASPITISQPQPSKKFGRGFIRDTDKDREEYPVIQKLLGAPSRLPQGVMKLVECAGIEGADNQSITSMCVGEAGAKAANVRLRALGKPTKKISPKAAYDVARMFAKSDPNDKLLDHGSIPAYAVRGWQRIGFVPEDVWPTYDATGDVLFEDINKEPPLDVLIKASQFEAQGTYAIKNEDEYKCIAVRHAHVQLFPVMIAIPADDAFSDNMTGDIESFSEKVSESNHMVLCVGHEVTSKGVFFWFINSYGGGWGDHGFFRIHESLMMDPRIDSLYAMPVVAKVQKIEEEKS